MSPGATSSPSPAAGWYPDPLDPMSERLWDGGRWSEQTRPGGTGSTPPPPPVLHQPAPRPSSAERQQGRSASGWSSGAVVGLGAGLLALLTVGGCVVLIGVVPLVATRSQGGFAEAEVEVLVDAPQPARVPTTVGPPLEPMEEFPPTTLEPGTVVSESAGPLETYGSAAAIGALDGGETAVFEIAVEEPVDLTELVSAVGDVDSADGVDGEDGEVLIGVPAAITLIESRIDPLPAQGLIDWTIVGGATATTYPSADPDTVDCEILDDELAAVAEFGLGERRRGVVCFSIVPADFDHPETRVVITIGDGPPATWIR